MQCFERLPISGALLSPSVLVTLEKWRHCAEEGPISSNHLERISREINSQGASVETLQQNDT